MNRPEYIVFQKFNEQGHLLELVSLLKKNNINYLVEDATLNMSFVNNELMKEFIVKLKREDFATVENLQKGIALSEIDSVDENYYLFDFSEDELMDIVKKPDEWGQFDILLASKILKEKGIVINQEKIDLLKKERIKELANPENSHIVWIYVGYILAFLGGFLGILIGWSLWKNKKILPNGDRIYNYTEADRKHGQRITKIGSISFIFWLLFQIIFFIRKVV